MGEFLYIYRGGKRDQAPEQVQQHLQRWAAWMKQLAEKGHLKNPGNPLEGTGKVVRTRPSKTVTDGPLAEKDIVCGFTVVDARDLDQAVELSLDCPIHEGGGFVEVRPILAMNR
jgi:hypothetical protein